MLTVNLVVTVMVYRPCNKVSWPIDLLWFSFTVKNGGQEVVNRLRLDMGYLLIAAQSSGQTGNINIKSNET